MTDDERGDRPRRLVRSGEEFSSDELRDGLVELERVDPVPEPDQEASERWARADELPARHPLRHWLRRRLHGDH
jgi:hypothetical protein